MDYCFYLFWWICTWNRNARWKGNFMFSILGIAKLFSKISVLFYIFQQCMKVIHFIIRKM